MNFLIRTITAALGFSLLLSACLAAPAQPAPATPTGTEPPTITPSPTLLATATPALMTGGEIPCYAGPGNDYEVIAMLGIAVKAGILAKDSSGEYWVIQIPEASSRCWLEARYATILGSPDAISTFPVESIPTKNIVRLPSPSRLEARASCVALSGNRAFGTQVVYRILVRLSWGRVQGEDGFRLYKDGAVISELAPKTTEYDYWLVPEPVMPENIRLSIEAFDKNGASEPAETTVRLRGICKGL